MKRDTDSNTDTESECETATSEELATLITYLQIKGFGTHFL